MMAYLITNKVGGDKFIMTRRTLARCLALVGKEKLLEVCQVGAIKLGDLSYYRQLYAWHPEL